MPVIAGDAVGVDDVKRRRFSTIASCTAAAGDPRPRRDRSGLFSRNTAPAAGTDSTSTRLEERELVAGDKLRLAHEVRRSDRARPEPEVRHRHRAGLLRVVHEVALRVERRLLADDLDRVLVGAHQFAFLDRVDVLSVAAAGAAFLLEHTRTAPTRSRDHLPAAVQDAIVEKRLHLHVIDANRVAQITAWVGGSTQSCRPASSR